MCEISLSLMAPTKTIRLQNVASGKNLRIHDSKVDANGGNGPFTKFIMHKTPNKLIKLQSAQNTSEYVALGPNGQVRTGPGGKFCEFQVVKHEKRVVSLKSAHSNHYLGFTKDGNFHLCSNPKADGQRKKSKFNVILA